MRKQDREGRLVCQGSDSEGSDSDVPTLTSRVRTFREGDALFLHFLNVQVRVLLELLKAGGAAEIDSIPLIVGIKVFIDQTPHHRALGLVFCHGSAGKDQKGQTQNKH
jgi:hypothetical protein